jgi:hypothetical protein
MGVFNITLEPSRSKDGGDKAHAPHKGGDCSGGAAAAPELESALRKAGRRLIPLTMLIAITNHMDRSK